MHNHYKAGSEAYSAMQDSIHVQRDLDDAVQGVEAQFEGLCSHIDDMEYERDTLSKELQEAIDRLEHQEQVVKQEVKEHVREILLRFQDIITNLEIVYELADKSPDNSVGTGSNGSSESTPVPDSGPTASEGPASL